MDTFQDFPNLHPLFVHFPIVLLLLAALAQFLVLFKPGYKELKWLVLFFAASGFTGALIAILNASHLSGDADAKAFARIQHPLALVVCISHPVCNYKMVQPQMGGIWNDGIAGTNKYPCSRHRASGCSNGLHLQCRATGKRLTALKYPHYEKSL